MELVVLGSGAYAPDFHAKEVRNPAGYAAVVDGRVILLDLGFGNVRQLARAGLDPSRVSDAFFTHRHPDHCADLAALLFSFRYGPKPKNGLRLWGPPGFKRFWRELSRTFRPWLGARGYRLKVEELGDGARVSGRGWEMAACTVPHPTPSLAYRLASGGRSLVYTGDSGPSGRLAAFARGCGLLVAEATLPPGTRSRWHMNVREALALAEASGCRRTLFTHVSAGSEAALRRLAPGRLARDLMRLGVPNTVKYVQSSASP